MKQGVYELSATQQYPLGKYVRVGNKGFVYARAAYTSFRQLYPSQKQLRPERRHHLLPQHLCHR
ncbi:unnamed protein product [marine sediment metagenome]|uniref:Uncharacterized protein n=1 Tax=marine sediment metagenome TaxID=412755 RepID=X1VXU0_9ZZZZ